MRKESQPPDKFQQGYTGKKTMIVKTKRHNHLEDLYFTFVSRSKSGY